jgi:hypothetical protein
MLLVAALTFVPVLLCLAQGQDSLLHLLLVILVFISLRRQRAFAAGCWLGLGLFKFQLTLPLFLVLILSLPRNSRTGLVRGFSLTALALAGLSVAACGWSVFTGYGKFLLHYPQQPSGNIFPQVMANLRGLTGFFCAGPRSPGCIAVLSVLSAAALVKTLLAWQHAEYGNDAPLASRQAQFDLAFSSTVLFALLVSYHLYPHDLSLLLLPISLLLWHARARTALLHTQPRSLTVGLSALLFLPPPHLFALLAGGYALLAIPLFLLLFVIAPSGPLTPPATTLEKATLRRDSR